MEVVYRKAELSDLERIAAFVDYWLTGGGKAVGIPGAGHDFFVPVGRHEAYLAKYAVLLAIYESEIVGWAVKTKKGVLIHLLVAATFRRSGIGSELLRRMSPDVVRSKFDQSSGDPAGFYRKHGYVKASSERLGKKKNIELFVKKGVSGRGAGRSGEKGHRTVPRTRSDICGLESVHCRSIDAMAEKLHLGNFHPERFLD